MSIPIPTLYFPHPLEALEDGLLAYGGDLSIDRLLLAYRYGIFPWYNKGDEILWWFLNPRLVMYCDKLKVSKSMRPYLNKKKFRITFDRSFEEVIRSCKSTCRDGQEGTWIHKEIITAYLELHELGHAHSVEVWEGNNLVGGLYGISLGRIFYGESMFSRVSNASKIGFITLAKVLEKKGFYFIDCQQSTDHLKSLGAEEISGRTFYKTLKKNIFNNQYQGKWCDWVD